MAKKIAEAPQSDVSTETLTRLHRAGDRSFPCGDGKVIAVEKEEVSTNKD